MATVIDMEKVMVHVRKGVQSMVDEALEEEIKKAVAAYEKRLRSELPKVVMALHDHYRVDRNEREVIIRVSNEALK